MNIYCLTVLKLLFDVVTALVVREAKNIHSLFSIIGRILGYKPVKLQDTRWLSASRNWQQSQIWLIKCQRKMTDWYIRGPEMCLTEEAVYPSSTSMFLAQLLICLKRSGPNKIPPYHRETTTMTLRTSRICGRQTQHSGKKKHVCLHL